MSNENPFRRESFSGSFAEGYKRQEGESLSDVQPADWDMQQGKSVIGRKTELEKKLTHPEEEMSENEREQLESYIAQLQDYEDTMLSKSAEELAGLDPDHIEARIDGIQNYLNAEERQSPDDTGLTEEEIQKYQQHLEALKEARQAA